jgi:hypothetical protein
MQNPVTPGASDKNDRREQALGPARFRSQPSSNTRLWDGVDEAHSSRVGDGWSFLSGPTFDLQIMKFRIRPGVGVKRMNGADDAPCLNTDWPIHRGDHVVLHPEADELPRDLEAEVLEVQGEFVLVRSLHDLYRDGEERVASRGDTFLVRRSCVHAVGSPSGVGLASYPHPVLEA